MCRIARFYGIDPRGMSRTELDIWDSNIAPLWAEEILRDRGASLCAEDLRNMTYLVTGSWKEADKAYAKRVIQESRNQEPRKR